MVSITVSSPEIKREKIIIVKRMEVFGEEHVAEVEKEVIWIRRCEGVVVAKHGDKIVKEFSTYNDFYGTFTSIQQESYVSALADSFSVDRNSSMSIEVLAYLRDVPVYETESDRQWNVSKNQGYKSKYTEIPGDWKIKSSDGSLINLNNEQSVLANRESVWSSKNSKEDNQKKIEAFIAKWQPIKEPV